MRLLKVLTIFTLLFCLTTASISYYFWFGEGGHRERTVLQHQQAVIAVNTKNEIVKLRQMNLLCEGDMNTAHLSVLDHAVTAYIDFSLCLAVLVFLIFLAALKAVRQTREQPLGWFKWL